MVKCLLKYRRFVICRLYLESCQILQLGEIAELQEERVDADEGEDVQDVEEEPDDQHQDVVREDHVVHDP